MAERRSDRAKLLLSMGSKGLVGVPANPNNDTDKAMLDRGHTVTDLAMKVSLSRQSHV